MDDDDDQRRCSGRCQRQSGGRCRRTGYIYIGSGHWRCARHVDELPYNFAYSALSDEQVARAERVLKGGL